MDKENDNVTGRLGSQYNSESWSERMCTMSEEASGDESGAHDSEEEVHGFLYSKATIAATLGAAFVGSFVVSIIISRMWNEDDIKLHVLSFATRVLQTIAFSSGKWAIECERAYNEYVNALH
jgi:hypothetical protein